MALAGNSTGSPLYIRLGDYRSWKKTQARRRAIVCDDGPATSPRESLLVVSHADNISIKCSCQMLLASKSYWPVDENGKWRLNKHSLHAPVRACVLPGSMACAVTQSLIPEMYPSNAKRAAIITIYASEITHIFLIECTTRPRRIFWWIVCVVAKELLWSNFISDSLCTVQPCPVVWGSVGSCVTLLIVPRVDGFHVILPSPL